MRNIFNHHPNSVGETYFQHFCKAFGFGFSLMLIAFRAFIHAILPFCFEYSVREKISKLNDELQSRKDFINSDKN